MANTTVRSYNVSDAEMMGEARNFAGLLRTHLSDFAALDADVFTEEYITELETITKQAEDIPSDKVLIDIQAKSTEDVVKTIEKCYEEISFAKYYVKKLFEDSKPTMNEFGYNDLKHVNNNSDKMVIFMSDFTKVVVKYNTALTGAQYPANKIPVLADLQTELKTKRDEQKRIKKERPIKTAQRVTILNKIWVHMVKISEASSIIYKDSPEKRALFQLPSNSNTNYRKNQEDTSDEKPVTEE